MAIPTFERGKTATLYCTFSLYRVPVDPVNPLVTIFYQDDVQVAASTPVRISTGHYYYEISIPNTWSIDYYNALWTGTISGTSFKWDQQFKIIKEVTEVEGDLPTGSYCLLADVLRELRGVDLSVIDGIETDITSLIPYAERRLEQKCHRTFKETSEAAYLDGNDSPYMMLPHRPITAVSSVILRVTPNVNWVTFTSIAYINCEDALGQTVRVQSTDAVVQVADLLIDCALGKMIIPERVMYIELKQFPFWNYMFMAGNANVYVAYTWGYDIDSIPEDIRIMCAKMTSIEVLYKAGDQVSGGSVGKSVDGLSRSWPGIPYGNRIDRLQTEIDEIARNYREIGVN